MYSNWKKWIKDNKNTCQAFSLLIVISLIAVLSQLRSDPTKPQPARNIDSYIPEGFVLVPVELSNSPALDGILTHKGVVDLYTGDPTSERAEKVAQAVKIIRSPLNPSHFAILSPEESAGFLIQRFQAFHAVIQNPQHKKKTVIQPLKKKNKRSIVIELDSSLDL